MNHLLTFLLFTTLQQPIDGTILTFTLRHDTVTIRINRWTLTTTKAAEMNIFVDTHLREIDPNKIVLYGDPNLKYKDFHSVLEVLKKHDWMKFKLETTNPKPKPPAPKPPASQT